jgi:hypothetical protein
MVANVLGIISAIAVLGSLIFAGWQVRELVNQGKISNANAKTSTLISQNALIGAWYEHLIVRPELRPYFFEDAVMAPADPDHTILIIMADRLADVLEANVLIEKLMPGIMAPGTWTLWPRQMLEQSPCLRAIVTLHQDWWPNLAELMTLLPARELPERELKLAAAE